MGWASSHSWTIASMDMRSDNIMGSAEAPIFLDWQFAERAPGGFDLATLLSTSSDCDYDEALHAIAAYATGAGPAGSDSRDEFVVGLLARTLFAIPVVTLLSHPTPSSRVARDAAIRRLKRLLTYFQDEAFDVIGWV
jgi:hypothetical protein